MPSTAADHTVQIALVDLQSIFRAGFRALVDSEPTLSLVAEAPDLTALFESLDDETSLDVVVIGIRPGAGPDLDDVRSLLEKNPTIAQVVFATSKNNPGLRESLLAGARGYLDSEFDREDIVDALKVAGRGKCLQVPAEPLLRLLQGLPASKRAESGSRNGFARLTSRELDILDAMSSQETYGRIADRLGLAPSSVKKYAHSVITKLGASNRSTAVIQAYRHGLLEH